MGRDTFVKELREKTRELESLLDAYSERLRRMRQRNRELEEEISSFEADLDRLREWLADELDESDG
jgi:predicted nuclease with TOPRIM domain